MVTRTQVMARALHTGAAMTRTFVVSNALTLTLTLTMPLGCSSASEEGDPIDDSFLSGGKADGFGFEEGSPEAVGILRAVNEATFEQLDTDAQLYSNAARNIVAHRDGDDGEAGTRDDDPFDTLVELDAVPYVGKSTLASLYEYADALGYIVPTPTGEIGALVAELEGMFPHGHGNGTWEVTSREPIEMVREYIAAKWGDDPDTQFDYKEDATSLDNWDDVGGPNPPAGTLTFEAALDAVRGGIDWTYEYDGPDNIAVKNADAERFLTAMRDAGGRFGFDGREQHGCAAGTHFLLVLDVGAETPRVFGIDLNPCVE